MRPMGAITFDTLKFARRLKVAGVPVGQVWAEAEALAEVFSKGLATQLVTKVDVHRLEQRLSSIDGEIRLLTWMVGLVIGGIVALMLKAFFV